MKIDRDELLAALKAVGISAEARGVVEATKCVELSALKDGLGLRATNVHSETRTSVGCEPPALEAPVLLNHARLSTLVGGMPCGEVEVAFGADVTLAGGTTRFAMRRTEGELPAMVTTKPMASVIVPAATLARMIGAVERAAGGPDSSRAVLKSVALDSEDGRLAATAADGRRIASVRSGAFAPECEILLPSAFARSLRGILAANADAQVTVTADRDTAAFAVGDYLLVRTRLVEGAYVGWRQLRRRTEYAATFATRELADAIRRARLVCDTDGMRRIDLEIGGGRIALTASGWDGAGRSVDEVAAKTDAEAIELISANPDIVLDALDALDADEATLGYDGYGKPFTIRSEADGYEGILIPLVNG